MYLAKEIFKKKLLIVGSNFIFDEFSGVITALRILGKPHRIQSIM